MDTSASEARDWGWGIVLRGSLTAGFDLKALHHSLVVKFFKQFWTGFSSICVVNMISHDSKIVIVGGGVFGLSTALWLAEGGYGCITVFDRWNFDENFYNPANGCDGASADINKVFRMAYGNQQR